MFMFLSKHPRTFMKHAKAALLFVNLVFVLTTLAPALTAQGLGSGATIPATADKATPGGGNSQPSLPAIDNSVPVLTRLDPASLTVNAPETPIIIKGSGFTSSSTIQVNGETLHPTGWNAGQLLFTLPASELTSLGTLSITVSNAGGAVSNPLRLTVDPNPVPTLSSLSPDAAAIRGADFPLTLFGSNFVPASAVHWNGSARPTTYVSSSELTATIHAADIASFGNFKVTVSNPSPGGGVSAAITFTTYLALAASGLVYSPSTQLLYASVPSHGGSALGNSIVSIDPYTGNLSAPIWVGSEPGLIALSSDGSTIWVALSGSAAVREVNLDTRIAGRQIYLGGGIGVYNPPNLAQALAVMPGYPNTLAVAAPTTSLYTSLVTIYDHGVARPNAQDGAVQCCSGVLGLAFNPTGTSLYEGGSGYGVATVNSTGITASKSLNASVSTNALDIDNGRAYLTSGVILNANTGTQLGVFTSQGTDASGPVATDSALGKGFVLVNPSSGQSYQINVYDLSTFDLKGEIPVTGVNNFLSAPSSLGRWGQDGLAFTSGSQVYVLTSPLVKNLSTSLADLKVTASIPPTGTTGTNLTYNLTVSNAGPVTAAPATLIDTLPNDTTLHSVTASQGECIAGPVINCNLGNLNSGSSATIKIILTPLVAGTLTNTAVVSAPQGDPNLANNTVISTTTVTGVVYYPTPTITSISPEFVKAHSGSFTLTVNGSGFASDSKVHVNSTAVPTTFVSDSQLTASVGASTVAAMGWAWITVANPSPGGGTSSSLPLTIYKVISLDINRLTFDPFTRNLYATIPSTAPQVAGNSLQAINPASGSFGTRIHVGSEPNRLSESSDGKYLYISLTGAESITSVNLTTLKQGPTFPIFVPGSPPTQVAPRDLAVAPGDDNLLAVDTGSGNGLGLLDISGSTATMRANLTGPYTGSSLAFANSTTLYSYDSDTSGAEFYRWSVTSTGLKLENDTGYTLDGMGGFTGAYGLFDGLVYGFAGGVANPTTTPPTQLGQFAVSSAQGSSQSIEGSGVSANPSYRRVFYLGETLAGSANPVLLSYDSNRYVMLDMQQFTGSAEGQDLVRWGRDGLAWHSSNSGPFGDSTPGAGQLFLMRGPFVLPEWNTVQATPNLVSVSPASATAGSGNLMLTLTGSGFVPGAVMEWNGSERTTTYVDGVHLEVAIPAADVSHAGTATLVVNNPGSSNSSSISFTIL
jgi:uncharacterized repeat protein (TIGR01451 family)